MSAHAAPPRVSVVIPAYNAAETIDETLASVWAQTFDDFEVIVTDDASTDDTAAVVRAHRDPRLRLVLGEHNRGCAGNNNFALEFARGELIKFLDADDLLDPECLARLAACFDGRPEVGMAFCRRRVLIEGGDQAWAREWLGRYGDVSSSFGPLEAVNEGRELFSRWAADGRFANWIGEPVTVMVRRELIERVGTFSERVRQMIDRDMWVRLVAATQVAFVDEPLATYRLRGQSISHTDQGIWIDWLDKLWMFEGLRQFPELWDERLEELRRAEWRMVRSELRRLLRRRVPARGRRLGDALRYAGWRIRAMTPLREPPTGRLGPPRAVAQPAGYDPAILTCEGHR